MRHSNLLYIAVFILAVSGCSAEVDHSKEYPSQFYNDFFNSCVAAAAKVNQRSLDAIQKSCSCSANTVQKNISYADIVEMAQGFVDPSVQTKKGEATHQHMMQLGEKCH